MFECASTFVSRRAIVQVFDEHVFDIVSLEVVMSVSFATKPAVSFPARPARRRVEAQRGDDPSFLRAPAAPRRSVRSSRRGIVVGTLATLALSIGAGALGLALQPAAYNGPTVVKAAVSGDSVWSLAQGVNSERPLEEIVSDIERLNDLSGALQPGQRVVVPVR